MNLDSWKKLPPDVQKVFESNTDWLALDTLKESRKPEDEGLELAKKAGVQVRPDGQGRHSEIRRYI